MLTSVSNKGC